MRSLFAWKAAEYTDGFSGFNGKACHLDPPSTNASMTDFLYFDCLSGISGDMTLAALIDLGADCEAIESAVQSMGLPKLSIKRSDVKKCGFRACFVEVNHPPEHAHRHLHHIHEMIDGANEISADAKSLAKRIFGHVADAEAKVHGTTLEKVHFHEVGAVDSIADIVGVSVAITQLGIGQAMASPIPTGSGTIVIDHGRVSVPAPATAEILCGIPIAPSSIAKELTTPTGAAIIRELCTQFGPLPALTVNRIGYGAGSMDLENQPNILRVLIGERGESQGTATAAVQPHPETVPDEVIHLETNVDDATGEQLADCCERLLNAGALDVIQIPCIMKKGRSGVKLSVLAKPETQIELETLLFLHSGSIGVRKSLVRRDTLPRQDRSFESEFGMVSAKRSRLPGGETREKVDYESRRRVADTKNCSLIEADRHLSKAISPNESSTADEKRLN
ncbi:MAG: nickel pincer cofactor biosynthesis protein LarC [Planctomycetota bacterium]